MIANIGKEAKISKASAEKAVNAFADAVTKALKKEDKLTIKGFGTFSVVKRKPVGLMEKRKATSFKHVAEPATAQKILKSLKIFKASRYAIYNKLDH